MVGTGSMCNASNMHEQSGIIRSMSISYSFSITNIKSRSQGIAPMQSLHDSISFQSKHNPPGHCASAHPKDFHKKANSSSTLLPCMARPKNQCETTGHCACARTQDGKPLSKIWMNLRCWARIINLQSAGLCAILTVQEPRPVSPTAGICTK